MGLDYAYEFISERTSADRLVRAMCPHVVPDDRKRLMDYLNLHLGLIDVMEHITQDTFERRTLNHESQEICLSFLFAMDEHVLGFTDRSKDKSSFGTVEGKIPIGCVWTSIKCGKKFVVIRATAATSDMSILFEQSTSVRATITEVCQTGNPLLVLFDDEQSDLVAVWPQQGRFTLSATYQTFEDEQGDLKVDDYCTDLLASARRQLGDRSADSIG